MRQNKTRVSFCLLLCLVLLGLTLSGCAAMPNSGPSRMQTQRAEHSKSLEGVVVMKVDDKLARTLNASKRVTPFAEVFGSDKRQNYLIGPGDTLVVSVWENSSRDSFWRRGSFLQGRNIGDTNRNAPSTDGYGGR